MNLKKINYSFILLFLVFQNAAGQSDSLKKHNTYIGLNLLRIAAGDIEMQAMHQVIKRLTVGGAVGYDFNSIEHILIHRSTADFDSSERLREQGGVSNPQGRYFYGRGPVYRLYLDYNFIASKNNQWFISLEGVLKIRNYSSYYFGDGDMNIAFIESGRQKIKGISAYVGVNKGLGEIFVLRMYTGIGVRVLHSEIKRPGWHDDYSYYPPSNPTYILVLPSIHLGIAIMAKF